MSKPQHPSREALVAAAALLDCQVEAIAAVAEVEAGHHGAFLPSGEPVILYEPHLFGRLTAHQFDGAMMPGCTEKWCVLSRRAWAPGTYGPVSMQHRRLQAAAELNRDAALRACSWGLFQILGRNHLRAGHESLQSFVNAMYRSADDHLAAFVSFVRSSSLLLAAIRSQDWDAFARGYNGTGQVAYYAGRMGEAFSRAVRA